MLMEMFEKKLSWLISIGGAFTSCLVLAWNTSEPVNAPKLLVLGFTGFASLFFLLSNRKIVETNVEFRLLLGIFISFHFFALISIFVSEAAVVDGFFGVWGRNTGFYTYLCLSLILISASQIRSSSSAQIALGGLFYAGVINVIYFVFTLFGIELIPWNNIYKVVLGTFGNPNFVGAFMGLFSILCVARLVDDNLSMNSKIVTGLFLAVALFEIKKSLASQGVVVAGLGFAIIGFFYIGWKLKSKILFSIYCVGITTAGLIAVAGALNKGPLADAIYKSSISYRGQYWKAAWNSGVENPIFGVGMDSFGLWYRRMREASALVSPGKNVTTNAAHNVYLDMLASGGFPLFISYILINLFIVYKIIQGMRKFKDFDITFVGLVALWVCYQAQSIVSINQIGVVVWGWILGGLLIGYQGHLKEGEETRSSQSQNLMKLKGKNIKREKGSISIIPIIIGGIIGGAIASPPYLADVKWRDTVQQPSAENLELNSKVWPLAIIRFVQASTVYANNGLAPKGLEIAKLATEEFPNDFVSWYFYYSFPTISPSEKERARQRLIELDPLNPDFK